MKIKDIVLSIAGAVIRVAILILAIYVVIEAGKKAYDFGFRIFTEEPMSESPGREVTVNVTDGDSESDIATMLEEKGIIREALLFRIQKKALGYKKKIEPGAYKLNTCMTTDEILETLVGPITDDDSPDEESDEGVDELNPETDDITGLESGGVLSEEEGGYSESEAFEDDVIELIDEEDGEDNAESEETPSEE